MRAITRTLTTVPSTGTAIDYGTIPENFPLTMLLYPGRTGEMRLQWLTGEQAAEGGEYVPVPQAAGGDDPLVFEWANRSCAPTHIASTTGTINVRYSVYRREA